MTHHLATLAGTVFGNEFAVYKLDDHCQESLFKAMSYPDFYPLPVRYVMQKDTHISKVFLTREYAYRMKNKHPVALTKIFTARLLTV